MFLISSGTYVHAMTSSFVPSRWCFIVATPPQQVYEQYLHLTKSMRENTPTMTHVIFLVFFRFVRLIASTNKVKQITTNYIRLFSICLYKSFYFLYIVVLVLFVLIFFGYFFSTKVSFSRIFYYYFRKKTIVICLTFVGRGNKSNKAKEINKYCMESLWECSHRLLLKCKYCSHTCWGCCKNETSSCWYKERCHYMYICFRLYQIHVYEVIRR